MYKIPTSQNVVIRSNKDRATEFRSLTHACGQNYWSLKFNKPLEVSSYFNQPSQLRYRREDIAATLRMPSKKTCWKACSERSGWRCNTSSTEIWWTSGVSQKRSDPDKKNSLKGTSFARKTKNQLIRQPGEMAWSFSQREHHPSFKQVQRERDGATWSTTPTPGPDFWMVGHGPLDSLTTASLRG